MTGLDEALQAVRQPAPDPAATRRLALVASKGTLDQAYSPLILATTAASLGWEVGIYFTFHGLDVVHRRRLRRLKVAPVGNPAGPVRVPTLLGSLPGGTALATVMMRRWMKRAAMPGVDEFLEMATGLGVTLYACATTMGVMGVERDDLVPEVQVAGAAAFLDFAASADVQLYV